MWFARDLKRARMKRLVADLEEIPHIRSSMLTATGNVVPSHLLDHQLFDFKRLTTATGDVEAELDVALGHTDEELQHPRPFVANFYLSLEPARLLRLR